MNGLDSSMNLGHLEGSDAGISPRPESSLIRHSEINRAIIGAAAFSLAFHGLLYLVMILLFTSDVSLSNRKKEDRQPPVAWVQLPPLVIAGERIRGKAGESIAPVARSRLSGMDARESETGQASAQESKAVVPPMTERTSAVTAPAAIHPAEPKETAETPVRGKPLPEKPMQPEAPPVQPPAAVALKEKPAPFQSAMNETASEKPAPGGYAGFQTAREASSVAAKATPAVTGSAAGTGQKEMSPGELPNSPDAAAGGALQTVRPASGMGPPSPAPNEYARKAGENMIAAAQEKYAKSAASGYSSQGTLVDNKTGARESFGDGMTRQTSALPPDAGNRAEARTLPLPGRENGAPIYPSLARQRGYEGVVVLAVEVLATGAIGNIKLKKTSGYVMLDQAALEAVRSWRF
ncbi:MAG: TonB family protein, partial [Smithellaceae bacterium]|nr:TonB family protein [Smithellaceae bacterium]